jgi:very-short-patch-repair endonuclease
MNLQKNIMPVSKLQLSQYSLPSSGPCGHQGEGQGGDGLTAMKGQTNKIVLTTKLQQTLRRNLTDAEQKLWRGLRGCQMAGCKFRRQHPFGNYILDFVSLDARLVIEVDGGQHVDHIRQDKVRDEALTQAGFKVLRFWNNQVLNETAAVLDNIYLAIKENGSDPASIPIPLPASPLKGEAYPVSFAAATAADNPALPLKGEEYPVSLKLKSVQGQENP